MLLRTVVFILLLMVFGNARSQNVADGPYISYTVDSIRESTILQYDDLLKPVTKNYAIRLKDKLSIQVVPPGHPSWMFSVHLKPFLAVSESHDDIAGPILFLSDIEGEFDKFREILIAAKVMDTAYQWKFGKGRLVIAGDLFDRGRSVAAELWLLYKLESDAAAAGGSVRVILGNHDIMNLYGDHRYSDAMYFKNAWVLKTDITSLYDVDTELGRWLRSKNTIERIGDVLVMHGGMSPSVQALGRPLERLNGSVRRFYGVPRAQLPDSVRLLFDGNAVFWYRGYFMNPRMSEKGVDSILAQYHVKYILVGHTILNRNIASYYHGKLVGIDRDLHSDTVKAAAALYEDHRWWVIGADGQKRSLVYLPANDVINDRDIL